MKNFILKLCLWSTFLGKLIKIINKTQFIYSLILNKVLIKTTVVPRFEINDKDGIIFNPLVPRAGQTIIAECNVVALSPENIKSVSWKLKRFNDGKEFYLATNNNVFQFKNPTPRLFAYHDVFSNKWLLKFAPLDRDDIGNLTCFLADTGNTHVTLTRFLDVHSEPIILESSTKDVDLSVGASEELKCYAQGYPKPVIYWLRADGRLFPDGTIIHRVFIIFSYYFEII